MNTFQLGSLTNKWNNRKFPDHRKLKFHFCEENAEKNPNKFKRFMRKRKEKVRFSNWFFVLGQKWNVQTSKCTLPVSQTFTWPSETLQTHTLRWIISNIIEIYLSFFRPDCGQQYWFFMVEPFKLILITCGKWSPNGVCVSREWIAHFELINDWLLYTYS